MDYGLHHDRRWPALHERRPATEPGATAPANTTRGRAATTTGGRAATTTGGRAATTTGGRAATTTGGRAATTTGGRAATTSVRSSLALALVYERLAIREC